VIDNRKLALYFTIHHTPTFINFFGPVGEGQFCKIRLYQEPAALSRGGAYQGGRRWGKTFLLKWKAIQGVFRYPRKEQLLAVFRRPHLKNIFEPIVAIILAVNLFREYLLTGKEYKSVSRDILHEIKFKSRHSFFAIAVGDDPLATMIKGRSPCRKSVDEAQDFPQRAANVLSSTMDPAGCEEEWAGVVDGRRDTPFFAILEKSERFRKRVFKFTRRYDPHFSQDDLLRAAEEIEGGERGDKFGQEVDAEHGNPIAAVWNIDDLIECVAGYDLGDVEPRAIAEIIITPKDYSRGDDPVPLFTTLRRSDAPVLFGIDVGQAEPTMVLPFIQEGPVWVLKNIIQIRDHVDTVSQFDLVKYIISQFPGTIGVGVDVTQHPALADMLSSDSRELEQKITRVGFNKNVIYAFEYIRDEKQVQRYYQEEGKRVKIGDNVPRTQKTKNFSTEKARQILARRDVLFYYHPELVEDFTSEMSKTTQGGIRIDTPSNVHIPEAFRCFIMAHYEKLGEVARPHEEQYETIMPSAAHSGLFGRQPPPRSMPMSRPINRR